MTLLFALRFVAVFSESFQERNIRGVTTEKAPRPKRRHDRNVALRTGVIIASRTMSAFAKVEYVDASEFGNETAQ